VGSGSPSPSGCRRSGPRSFHAGVNTLAYAASKGRLARLMLAQANEWAPLGIRVNAVAPG
jgi:NAD(P)-dependent dehydrogenase (short-subunit alcohol dehydrogenase family)